MAEIPAQPVTSYRQISLTIRGDELAAGETIADATATLRIGNTVTNLTLGQAAQRVVPAGKKVVVSGRLQLVMVDA